MSLEPGSPEWRARYQMLLAQEAVRPEGWWYLSFAEPGRFLGAVILRAKGVTSAIQNSHRLGLNPGGEVGAMELGPELPKAVPDTMTNRLLTREELQALDQPVN